jgi:primosomal protein N' (replication factor Y)
MRLNRHAGENMLICYHCAAFTQVPKQCPTCHAGRLKASGLAGSQRIAQAINECLDRYGHAKLDIPILDTDLVQTKDDQDAVLAKYSAMSVPIMVATQKVFSQRYMMQFDQIAVIEADALVYNPDFRTQERLVYQLEKLVDFKPQTLYLQSWDRSGAIAHAAGRTWSDFYDQELAERKALTWPPFVRIAKLSLANRNGTVSARQANVCADRLRRAAAHLGFGSQVSILGPTPALVERAGGRWTQNLILKTRLPSEKFNALLAHVGPEVLIDMDPRSIT